MPEVFSENVQISILPDTSTPSCGDSKSCYSDFKTKIGVGSEVTWVNQDSTIHTITSGNPFDGTNDLFDSEIIKAGKSFSQTFSQKGTFDYFCQLHPWAIGQIVVGDTDYTDTTPTPIPKPTPAPAPTPETTPSPIPTNDEIISPDFIPSSTGEQLKIQVNLSEDNSGANIAINVFDIDGNLVFTKMVTIDSNIADVAFSVSGNTITPFSNSPSVENKEYSDSTNDELISKTSIISVEPTCGPGTVLINGICQMSVEFESSKVNDVPTELKSTKNLKPILECGSGTKPVDGVCQVVKDTMHSNEKICFLFMCW